jgi:hypothetical protein
MEQGWKGLKHRHRSVSALLTMALSREKLALSINTCFVAGTAQKVTLRHLIGSRLISPLRMDALLLLSIKFSPVGQVLGQDQHKRIMSPNMS